MADSQLDISRSEAGGIVTLCVAGKLDARTAPRLNEELKALLAAGKNKLVCDMAGVTYIASAGVGTLKAGLVEAKKGGGDLRLAALRPEVQDVFDVLGFTKLFTIAANASSAASGL